MHAVTPDVAARALLSSAGKAISSRAGLSRVLGFVTVLWFGMVLEIRAETPEATSPSFLLAQAAVSASSGIASSVSFVLDATAGQSSVVGEATSTSYVLQSGFWTSGSDQPVPVELQFFSVGSDAEVMTGGSPLDLATPGTILREDRMLLESFLLGGHEDVEIRVSDAPQERAVLRP